MTKAKKILLAIIAILFAILIFPTIAKAANITYKTEYYSSINTAIYVNGLENNLEDGYDYYIYVTQDNTTTTDTIFNKATFAQLDSLFYDSISNQFYIKVSTNTGIFEKAGDYYAYIVKGKVAQGSTFTLIDGPTKLERPNLLPNGERIEMHFNKNGASYYISQYDYYTKMFGTDRKINFHLGKIEDTTILTKLTNKTSDAYDALYNYAKNNTNYLYSGNFDTTSTATLNYNIWQDYTGIKDGEYYFVYYELDTENGKYIQLDDVQVYTGKNGLPDEFVAYNPSTGGTQTPGTQQNPSTNNSGTSNNKQDSTTAKGILPYTGLSIGIITMIILVAIGGTYTFIRYNRLKGI